MNIPKSKKYITNLTQQQWITQLLAILFIAIFVTGLLLNTSFKLAFDNEFDFAPLYQGTYRVDLGPVVATVANKLVLATLILQIILTLAIVARLKDTYLIRTNRKLDERELDIRRRIFEKSYLVLSIVVSVASVFMLSEPRPMFIAPGIAAMSCILFIATLPSIIAAWHKNI